MAYIVEKIIYFLIVEIVFPLFRRGRAPLFLPTLFLLLAGSGADLSAPRSCWSLEPSEVLVIINKKVPDSLTLARYYMEKRGIPVQNLVMLSVTEKEQCSLEEYEKRIALPIRSYLKKRAASEPPLRCLVTLYGVPLTITNTDLSLREKAVLSNMQGKARLLQLQVDSLKEDEKEKRKPLQEKLDRINREIVFFKKMNKGAAVDSELALVQQRPYPLLGWIPNPHYLGYRANEFKPFAKSVFLVSRLDGPSPQIVRRIIDDSLAAEETGLHGKAYFDARWPDPGDKPLSGYALYDRSLHKAADHIKKSHEMTVILDEKPTLFPPGSCPDAALYCGWYSLRKYVDAFHWVPGSVGYHIASAECVTLKQPGSTMWCKMMLEKGVAATIGPVGEPYVEAFPLPDLFFSLLLEGKKTLAECFALSNPYLSWKMVLIGDPLYRPFKHKAVVKHPPAPPHKTARE